MSNFATKILPEFPDEQAPDGSRLRTLLRLSGGGMSHFELAPQETSIAVAHRTVEEIWFFIRGRGQMWRRSPHEESVVDVFAGVCVTIPLSTHFQFRCVGVEPLTAVGVTMPPWPGDAEAFRVDGWWTATVDH